MKSIILIFLFTYNLSSTYSFATNDNESKPQGVLYSAKLKTATDKEYPNNNAIGFRSKSENIYSHNKIMLKENSNGKYNAVILPGNAVSDTIMITEMNLLEMMPTVPEYVKGNDYLSYIALLNQEFGRIQVKFSNKNFTANGQGTEKNILTRVDVANNCLGKGLWEVIAYATEDGSDKLYFQCWFDFPEELYNELFAKRNGIAITEFDNILKNYGYEKSQKVDLNILRTASGEKEIEFKSLNNELYPLKGERETKARNIIHPTNYTSINDFLNDDTKFATFANPGQYTRDIPRATELSRFQELNNVIVSKTTSANKVKTQTAELQLYFTDKTKTKATKFIIGGLQLDKLPVLPVSNMHKGWQRPMGIANHSFYLSIDDLNNGSSIENPFYAFLLDKDNNWLDSHIIGIDGPLLFRDEANPDQVHLLLLSFERHAFVGHFVFNLPNTTH